MLAAMTLLAQAPIPQTVSYQGVLTDGSGTPVVDGSYSVTFKIYTVASGGSEIWSETLLATGHQKEASDHLRAVLEIDPQDVDGRRMLSGF
jgi:hypothetical protein